MMSVGSKDNLNTLPKKKHGMVLNLENKNFGVFGADQTPTPTRFIRNCEEVGLFQDLQNVNPFEETFRKAVESGKTGSTALQNCRLSTQLMTDDTLHTPHVFPHIIENESASKPDSTSLKTKTGSEQYQPERRVAPAGPVVRQEADTSQLRPIAPYLTSKPAEATQPVQLILEMPDGRLMQLNATPLGHNAFAKADRPKLDIGNVILRTSINKKQDCDISPLIKEKLKAHLGNASVNKQGKSDEQKQVEKEEGTRNKQLSCASNTSNSDDDDEIKRKRFLERNRAAAMRCREKRKCWVATLERRAEQLMTNNQQLQLELGALRAEVAQLKTLLLAHKDCSVTQAMCNNSIMTSPGNIEPLVKPEVHIIKPLSADEVAFRQNLKMKLKNASTKKSVLHNKGNVKGETVKIKRLTIDIESAKKSQQISPLVGTDEYLSSTFLPSETLEMESFKPVATQVIQVNPNVLNRRLPSPNIEGPLLAISPNTDSMDYS